MNESDDVKKDPAPQKPGADYRLPARLRDKLEDAGPGTDKDWRPKKRAPVNAIIAVVVLIAVVAGGWWWYQSEQARQREREEIAAAEEARRQAVADSIAAAVAYADSVAEAARADSIAAFDALPRWRQQQILAAQARAAAPATGQAPGAAPAPRAAAPPAEEAPQETGPFVLDVGQYLFEDPARRAADALKESTGLDATVGTVGSGDNLSYRVYLGRFSNRADAVRAANDLIGKSAMPQARVVPAPR
jgi:hypothetical protein